METPRIMFRKCSGNPNHHLWSNNGTWWLHYTVHLPDYTKRRVRRSLKTKCVVEARAKRDAVLSRMRFASRTAQNGALKLAA